MTRKNTVKVELTPGEIKAIARLLTSSGKRRKNSDQQAYMLELAAYLTTHTERAA